MFSATHQVRLTNAPFSAMAKVGDAEDSDALNVKYSPVAAKFWDRLVTGRDVFVGLLLVNLASAGVRVSPHRAGSRLHWALTLRRYIWAFRRGAIARTPTRTRAR